MSTPVPRAEADDLVRAFLEPGVVRADFQPIIRLADGEVVAWEALGRIDVPEPIAPDRALLIAADVGRAADLEAAYWEAAVEAGPPPDGALLFVNCGVAGITDPRMEATLARFEGPLVVEITEQVAVGDDDSPLEQYVDRWSRKLGVRFAVDDAGTGYSSMRRVVDLAPEFLKLDASLVGGIADDHRLRAVLAAMLGFATAVGSVLVAEGVERQADLDVLVDAGVPLAQGFLLGRPAPPWTLPTPDVIDLRDRP
jgi:EAL domain-containing protein (putative c-di-GMP-specific phosphodiesterase class I)